MWRTLTLSLVVALVLGTEVSQSEDVGSMAAVDTAGHEQLYNFSDMSAVLGTSRYQILAAQFECYLKIIHDPPHTEEGDNIVPIVSFVHSSADNSCPTGTKACYYRVLFLADGR
ncbi:calcitonin gene-related peptide type 1 receptor-like [Lates japonicus]